MNMVWMMFAVTALILAIGGLVAIRSKGELSPVSNVAGRFLLIMAVGTAIYPTFLSLVGVTIWVVGYIAFVVTLTAIIVVKTRRVVVQTLSENGHRKLLEAIH